VIGAIYEFDPERAADAAFVAGRLEHVVIGNRGRLLDVRRTPITITAIAADKGAFEVEIGAFEDAGARWEVPLEEVGHFQFDRDAHVASSAAVDELRSSVVRYDRHLAIDCEPAVREITLAKVALARSQLKDWMSVRDSAHPRVAVEERVALREGDGRVGALLEAFLADRGVADLDHDFAKAFVSNPSSGELVKGHAIVLAELGLSPYRGKAIRDPGLFNEPWSRRRRAEHLISRLAFVQELWSAWGYEKVTLYRGTAVDSPLPARSPGSFVSATFSREVATAHFEGGPTTQTAILWRQDVPISRLLMTFLETDAMNDRFHEAEAVLIADPTNCTF
jgi:hypothetical protein